MDYFTARNLTVTESDLTNKRHPQSVMNRLLNRVSLSVKKGEILGIVGPTGCGKTILLKTIAGFITPSEGDISIEGRLVTEKKPSERGMSMVFQDYALYPHMTSRRNIGFRLFMKNDPYLNPDARIDEIAKLLHLDEEKLLARYPKTISLGERQRVAIGKAIAVLPDMILFDEPLSNIEESLRDEIRHTLRKMLKDNNIAAIYVSHNQVEIAEVADTVAVMVQGRIEQTDTYISLYNDPKTYFVSLFIGEKTTNFIPSDEVSRLTSGKINYILTIRPNECSLSELPNSIALRGQVALIENFIQDKKKVVFIEVFDNLFGVEVSIDTPIEKASVITLYIPLNRAKYFDSRNAQSPERIYNLW